MIVVVGAYDLEPEDRAAFLASKERRMRESRAEAGNLEYVFAPDPIDPRRVVLLERWESREALDAHVAVVRSQPADGDAPVPTRQSLKVLEVVSP